MKRIYKRTRSKVIGGVASGIADYLSINPLSVRVVFIFATLGLGGTGILLYFILMLVLPKDTELFGYAYPNVNSTGNNANGNNQNNTQNVYNTNYQNYQNATQDIDENYREYYNSFYAQNPLMQESNGTKDNRIIFGLILILVGILILANMFIPYFTFKTIFPILLMIIGLFIIFGNKLRKN